MFQAPAQEYTIDGQPAKSADYDTTRPAITGDQNGDQKVDQSGSRGSITAGDTSAKTSMGAGGGGSSGGGGGGSGGGGGGGGYSLGASFATGPLQATTGLSGEIKNDNSNAVINFGNKVFSPFGGTANGGTSGAGLSTVALLGIGAAVLVVGVIVYAVARK